MLKLNGVTGFLAGLAMGAFTAADAIGQQPLPFDDGWRFVRGDHAGAESPAFADAQWANVDLPHDWSIAGPIAADNSTGSPGGFFPAGVGWYRKSFAAPADWASKHVAIQFDGVYMRSQVWINGQLLGKHVYGYTPFAYDLTPYLKPGQTNTIAVRVDNSRQMNSRWYSGSGINRHVRLDVREPIHITRFGTFVTTPHVSDDAATVTIATTIENAGHDRNEPIDVATQIFAADANGQPTGDSVAQAEPTQADFGVVEGVRQKTLAVTANLTLPHPERWSPDAPTLYVAVTTISANGTVLDTQQTRFGVRTIAVSAERGFELNGQPIELYGACVHDDNGPLGTAAFDRAEIRRVEQLKAAGFNAVRCAHNPPAPAFLDACDRLGLLVIDEAFDTWSLPKNREDFSRDFATEGANELAAMILRDRNHPSIVIWSLGNEIMLWGRDTPRGLADGERLLRVAKELDPTRLTTTAAAGWNLPDRPWEQMAPLLNQFDVVGYNYALHRYESDHERFPTRIIIGTESFPHDLFQTFDKSDRLPHVLGDFVWTGIDHLGESGIGRYYLPDEHIYFHGEPQQFPYHGAYCGDIDLTGFRKPISHDRNIVWGRGEQLYTAVIEQGPDGRPMRVADWGVVPSQASWTWPGREGKPLTVQIYSRCDSVRLYLNDTLMGEKPTTRAQAFKAEFEVPYAPGMLRTVGIIDGKEAATQVLTTAGPTTGLRLTADRTEIAADGQDLSYVTVESVDAQGNVNPTGDATITFSIDGPAAIAGVASGDYGQLQAWQGNQRQLFHGRAQVVIRTSHQSGTVTVRATAPTLADGEVILTAR